MDAEPNGGARKDVREIARAQVKQILTRSKAYRALPKHLQQQLANDTVKVAEYIAGGESGANVPASVAFADIYQAPDAPSGPARPAGQDITGAAASAGGRAMAELVREIDFPKFVAGLIDGVFNAIVDASIKQMEAYAELVKNVAKSVDQFMKDNVSENQARDYLVDRYPDHLELDLEGENPAVKPKEDADQESLPDFFSDLGLSSPVESVDDETAEQVLMPAARKRIAMDRQQLLATMVLMGINRLVVTNGNISASVVFRLDTAESIDRHYATTHERGGWATKSKRPGFWGWFRPTTTRETQFGHFKVQTQQNEDSEASIKMKAELKGSVNVNFRSETFPLERMADILTQDRIREKAPAMAPAGAQPATAATPAQTPAPAAAPAS